MRLFLFTYLIWFFPLMSFAHPKEIYYNDDLLEIDKIEFNKPDSSYKTYKIKFDLDTLIVNVKVQYIKGGKISKTKHDSIRSQLSALSKKTSQKIIRLSSIITMV